MIDRGSTEIWQRTGGSWHGHACVTLTEPHYRWFAELTTMEDLLTVINTLGGCVQIEDGVIRWWDMDG